MRKPALTLDLVSLILIIITLIRISIIYICCLSAKSSILVTKVNKPLINT